MKMVVIVIIYLISILLSCNDYTNDTLELSSIKIMYVEHWFMTVRPPLSCEQLRAGDFPYKSVLITDSVELIKWSEYIKSDNLVSWIGSFTGDCRICCELNFKDSTENLDLAIWPTGIKLNDSLYQFDSTLIRLLEPNLPRGYFDK